MEYGQISEEHIKIAELSRKIGSILVERGDYERAMHQFQLGLQYLDVLLLQSALHCVARSRLVVNYQELHPCLPSVVVASADGMRRAGIRVVWPTAARPRRRCAPGGSPRGPDRLPRLHGS